LINELRQESKDLRKELTNLKRNGYHNLSDELIRMEAVIVTADQRKTEIIKKFVRILN
jgi:hypothetical protein